MILWPFLLHYNHIKILTSLVNEFFTLLTWFKNNRMLTFFQLDVNSERYYLHFWHRGIKPILIHAPHPRDTLWKWSYLWIHPQIYVNSLTYFKIKSAVLVIYHFPYSLRLLLLQRKVAVVNERNCSVCMAFSFNTLVQMW